MTCHAVGNEALFYAQYFPVAKKNYVNKAYFWSDSEYVSSNLYVYP